MAAKYKFRGTGLEKHEKEWAKKRFNEYQKRYHLDSLDELTLLEELVFAETLQERHKKVVAKLTKASNQVENFILPAKFRDIMDEDLKRVFDIRARLQLSEEKSKKSFFTFFQLISKKFENWKRDNWSEREVICPWCAEIFYLNIRTDKFIPAKTPFFQGRVLANKPLFEVYKEGKLTKEQVAKILGTSVDYLDKLEELFDKSESAESK